MQESEDVKNDLRDLAISIAAAGGGDATQIAVDLAMDLKSATEAFYNMTHGQLLIGSVELINFTASFLEDKILERYGVTIPISSMTNLAGAVVGSYLYGFATGK